jgi:predicted dehydrogenase
MGRDYYETLALFDHAEMHNVPVTVFFNRLWDSDSLTIKKVISEGVIGRVFRADSRFERFRPELNPSAWRENVSADMGGGLLLDIQTHLVSTALDWFGPAQLVHASVREVRGAANDDVVLVLKHDSGVDSYLSASAIIGAPGPKLRLNGDKGSLVINELDRQEELLRKGFKASFGKWLPSQEITTEARIHKGNDSFSYSGVPGSYPNFYQQVRSALEIGTDLPVSRDFALSVARIIDQARENSIH